MSGSDPAAPATVDAYIAGANAEIRDRLAELRRRVLAAAPDAVESISYGMPTYRLSNGRPVFFACWKHHVSMHAVPVFDDELETDVSVYRSGKDTLRFPHPDPLPFDLVQRLVAESARR
jgi:uncharacterized protein YdhG (YjbR/CyaY superfamily)